MPSSPNASSSLPLIEVGTRLTDYGSLDLEVQDFAEGGYGLVVWGPNHANGGRMRALKLLRPVLLAQANAISPAEGERLRREFEREALIWCHLWPHAGIVTADALTRLPGWNDLPVLVLEYAPDGSLRESVSAAHGSRTGHLPLRSALAWGQQIAVALAVIHQPDPAYERPEPLVHCDLKPENVLLNEHGWALLTDLGLTRAYAATAVVATVERSLEADLVEQAPGDGNERGVRIAKIRAALQGAGLIPTPSGDGTAVFPLNPKAAQNLRQTTTARSSERIADMQTRSIRVPPISAALLTTLLAPRPATVGTALATEPGIGSRGAALGTPPYMPPEQWWGLNAVTPASDVYALGVLLFELFTGGRWSIAQHRWLDDDDDLDAASSAQSASERYTRFPHMPQFTPEARVVAEGGFGALEARQAFFAAWYAAHRAGPRWRLDDPAVGALTRGPLMELAAQPAQAARVLHTLSELIADCLAPEAARRPTAVNVQRRLGAIAQLAGVEPVVIPEVYSHTAEHQAIFWADLAITYGKIGQVEERLRLQRRAVELDRENPTRWLNLGAAFGEMHRYEEALTAFAEAERWLTPAYHAREPQRAERLALSLANNQANVLGNLGRYDEAIANYRRVLALHPDRADARFNLAATLLQWSQRAGATREQQMERLRTALVELQMVLVEAPSYAKAQALLGQIERDLARLEADER